MNQISAITGYGKVTGNSLLKKSFVKKSMPKNQFDTSKKVVLLKNRHINTDLKDVDPDSPQTFKAVKYLAGGAATGAATGAVVGSFVPIVGTAAGATVGAFVGVGAGAVAGLVDIFRGKF